MDSCLVSGDGVVVGVDGLVVAGDRVVVRHVKLSVSLDDHVVAAHRRTPPHQHQDQPDRSKPDRRAAELQHPGSVISLRTEAEHKQSESESGNTRETCRSCILTILQMNNREFGIIKIFFDVVLEEVS